MVAVFIVVVVVILVVIFVVVAFFVGVVAVVLGNTFGIGMAVATCTSFPPTTSEAWRHTRPQAIRLRSRLPMSPQAGWMMLTQA